MSTYRGIGMWVSKGFWEPLKFFNTIKAKNLFKNIDAQVLEQKLLYRNVTLPLFIVKIKYNGVVRVGLRITLPTRNWINTS